LTTLDTVLIETWARVATSAIVGRDGRSNGTRPGPIGDNVDMVPNYLWDLSPRQVPDDELPLSSAEPVTDVIHLPQGAP